jgi:hypothetical protein
MKEEQKPLKLILLLLLCAEAIFFVINSGLFSVSNIALAPYILNQPEESVISWYPVLNKTFNAFFMWRAPLLNFQIFDIASSELSNYLYLKSIVIFCLGNFILFKKLNKNNFQSLVFTSLGYLTSYALFGHDPIFLQSFQLLPWLVFFALDSSKSIFKLFGYIFIAILLPLTAWSFSPLVGVIALLIIFAFSNEQSLKFSKLVSILFLAHISLTFIEIEQPKTNYSQAARVVADDGVPGHLRPLIGPVSEIPFVDRNYERVILFYPSIIILLLGLSLLALNYQRLYTHRKLFILISILTFGIFLDIVPPEFLSSIMPIASFKRLIPYFYFYPLSPYLIFASGFLILLYINHLQLQKKNILFCGIAFLPLLISLKNTPFFVSAEKNKLHTEFINNKQNLKIEQIRNASYAILNHYGLAKSMTFKNVIKSAKFISPERRTITISNSGFNPEALRKELLDGHGHTRWYSTKQTGKEWLHIYFENPQSLSAIALRTGNFGTDFPRGLRISAREECQQKTIQSKIESSHYMELAKYYPWIGSLAFTDDQAPYLTPEGIVNIYFEKTEKIQCLLIEQIGQDNYFDWSVAEFKVAK